MQNAIISVAACLLVTELALADSEARFARRETNIAAQELGPALKELAQSRDLQILYFEDVVRHLRTGGAVGEITAGEALQKLLEGTGLTYKFLGDNTITIAPLGRIGGGGDRESERGLGSDKSVWERFRLSQFSDNKGSTSTTNDEDSGEKESKEEETDQSAVQEIVVTAQKREENLQEVPISISVLSGDDLDRSTGGGVTESLSRVPGIAALPYAQQGGGTNLTVRGVSAASPTFNGSSPVAYYLDSIPFGFVKLAIAPDANAYDLERIEVLRGPQGTLYGASALNGVVRVLTHDADLEKFEFKARASGSSTDGGGGNYRGDTAVNVPIVEGKLAARAVVGYEDWSGWIDHPGRRGANDSQIRNLRLKINAQPTDELSVGLLAWQLRSDYGAPSFGDDNQRRNTLFDESMTTDYDAYGLKINYDFPRISVVSMTSYLDYQNDSGVDISVLIPGTILTSGFDSTVFSQEVILNSSHEGPWRWTLGGSYRDAKDQRRNTIPQISFTDGNEDASESYAVFGEVSRRVFSDKLQWTLGLRHFQDDVYDKSLSIPGREGDTFDSTTPRAVLTWFPSDDFTVYGSYSEGFRSGAMQYVGTLPPGFPPARPDTLKNYELGAKGSLLEGRLMVDTALYYIDWQDVQQSILVPNPQFGGVTTALINAQSASGIGLDFSVTARPLERLELRIALSWNDLTMDSDVVSGGAVLFDKGDRLNFSSEYTVGSSADYVFGLGSGGLEGRFSASANYISRQSRRTIVGGARYVATGDSLLIARTSFSIQAPTLWAVTLYTDNVTNEQGIVYGAEFAGQPLDDWNGRLRPRTVGLQFEYRY